MINPIIVVNLLSQKVQSKYGSTELRSEVSPNDSELCESLFKLIKNSYEAYNFDIEEQSSLTFINSELIDDDICITEIDESEEIAIKGFHETFSIE